MNEIYYATNRNLTGEDPVRFGARFNVDRPFFYRVGKAVVRKRRDPKDPWDEAYRVDPKSVELFPEKIPEGEEGEALLGSAAAFAEIRAKFADRKEQRDVLLYIHGFASSFESALIRASELRDAYLAPPTSILNASEADGRATRAREPLVFVFCWPSDGIAFGGGVQNDDDAVPQWAYFSDRDDAEASGKAIARSFVRLIDFLTSMAPGDACGQRIHLVAHSMGNYALRHAVQQLKRLVDRARLPRIVDNAFLMAADEDADALELDHKLAPLFELARQVHVYHAADDRALIVSDKTKFNPDRLGERGPKRLSDEIGRVNVIDCGDVSDTIFRHGRHQYYRLVPEVIADVRAVLSGVRPDEVKGREIVEPGRRYKIRKQAALRKKSGFPPA